MNSRPTIVAASMLLAMAASLASQQEQQATRSEGLPAGTGRDVVLKVCADCHEPDRAQSLRLTREGWAALVDNMITAGALISEKEYPIVLDYLAASFAGEATRAIDVNTAPQIDLEAVVGLLRREAAAVIAYREKNGPFKSLDDLKKVPDVDFKKIEARRQFLIAMPPPAPAAGPSKSS